MLVVFPCYPGNPRQPDPMFSREYTAAKQAGFKVALVETEVQFGGDARIYGPATVEKGETSIYRGWLLKPAYYYNLLSGLWERGAQPLVALDAYLESYEFPRWYRRMSIWGEDPKTAHSIWFPKSPNELTPYGGSMVLPDGSFDFDSILSEVRRHFSGKAVLLKDYLKSRKEDWFDACFIPDGGDRENVKRVTQNFLRIVDENFTGGLVYREFHNYRRIGTHPKSRMPLTNEYRCFGVLGKVFFQVPYWAEGFGVDVVSEPPDIAFVEEVVKNIDTPFWAADFAELADKPGTWELVEINDGGAAGIPKDGNVVEFYEKLAKALS